MIIKDVTLTKDNNAITLSAKCKLRKIGWDNIYIRLVDPKQYDYVYEDASPFAAALLIPSMKLGEDLIIKGTMSQQVYDGMHAIMPVVLSWNIGLKAIKIHADKLVTDTHTPKRTAQFFSGGVDSFYTYLKHKNDPVETDRVKSFILVNGFDIDRRNTQLWDMTLDNVTAIADKEHVELVIVESNMRTILEPIMPRGDYTHGGCLAAVGLCLRREFRQIYIPSTFSVAEQLPWGSHLDVDKHWSSEKTTFFHDGVEATRLDKILLQVSKSPVALEHLRVCYMNKKGVYNCGTCDKCLRTMTSLYVAGVLDKTKTFPHHINVELVAAAPHVVGDGVHINHGEINNLKALKKRRLDPDLQAALETRIEKTKVMHATLASKAKLRVAKLTQGVIYLDFAYTGSYGYNALASVFGKKF